MYCEDPHCFPHLLSNLVLLVLELLFDLLRCLMCDDQSKWSVAWTWFDVVDFSEKTGIVVLSTVVPTSCVGVDSFDKTRYCCSPHSHKKCSSHFVSRLCSFPIYLSCLHSVPPLPLSSHHLTCFVAWCVMIGLSEVWHESVLMWLIWVNKLASWSCQLWYQHPSWVLTLTTKQDTVGVDSLYKSRFRCYCIDIYHFRISLHYLLPPLVITHFLLFPSTISHLQLLLPPSSLREISHQFPSLISLNLWSSHNFPLLSSPTMLHLILACLC